MRTLKTSDDELFTTPLRSYGTQKAIAELLLADYSPCSNGAALMLKDLKLSQQKVSQRRLRFFVVK
ncbi:hypothetical protein QO002_005469 [Pararhizobium capsulatum DSM 1112]|uniref:Transposase n=1 Tax=Pararhizobium capsulatum DSM 1112 TaxID=1121113 RepID=A0ABU0BYC9_9HYPH|nr:hypothetical protein [Pararhizobium capsulatum DSM 1112]